MSSPGIVARRAAGRVRRTPASALLAPLFRVASPAGPRGRLSVLIFHRVRPAVDPLFPHEATAAGFRARLAALGDYCTFVPLDEGVRALAAGKLPARAVAVTFDDGYADNAEIALPILRELGVPATFFVASAYLGGGRMWNDTIVEALRGAPAGTLALDALGLGSFAIADAASRRRAIDALLGAVKHRPPAEREALVRGIAKASGARLPDDLMMTPDQVRSLAAAGMIVGAHTATHPILASVGEREARREIADGRDALEGIVRQPVRLFAYPNGRPGADYRREHVAIVRSLGFDAAFSTSPGAARAGDPLHELPRFTPWDRAPLRFGARLVANLWTSVARAA